MKLFAALHNYFSKSGKVKRRIMRYVMSHLVFQTEFSDYVRNANAPYRRLRHVEDLRLRVVDMLYGFVEFIEDEVYTLSPVELQTLFSDIQRRLHDQKKMPYNISLGLNYGDYIRFLSVDTETKAGYVTEKQQQSGGSDAPVLSIPDWQHQHAPSGSCHGSSSSESSGASCE